LTGDHQVGNDFADGIPDDEPDLDGFNPAIL
jgi:hypothetical protein